MEDTKIKTMRLNYKDCGKIGFTCSTFDLLHAGHITMLEEAKRHCDYLIVGLQTDPTIDRPRHKKYARTEFSRKTNTTGGSKIYR